MKYTLNYHRGGPGLAPGQLVRGETESLTTLVEALGYPKLQQRGLNWYFLPTLDCTVLVYEPDTSNPSAWPNGSAGD